MLQRSQRDYLGIHGRIQRSLTLGAHQARLKETYLGVQFFNLIWDGQLDSILIPDFLFDVVEQESHVKELLLNLFLTYSSI